MATGSGAEEGLVGRDVFDVSGEKIGTVEAVRLGPASGSPQWLVVKPELPGSEMVLIPMAEVRRSSERLSVIHTKERVGRAPKVADADALSDAEEGKLCSYYGLSHGGSGDESEGCEEMKDVRPAG